MELDAVTSSVLKEIDAGGWKQEGAYNLRFNGQALCHGDSENIKIKRKERQARGGMCISAAKRRGRRSISL